LERVEYDFFSGMAGRFYQNRRSNRVEGANLSPPELNGPKPRKTAMKQEDAGTSVCDRIAAEQSLLIDKQQVAEMTSLSVRTIERLVSQGRFMTPIRLGRKMMWHREKFIAWLVNGAVLPPRNNLRGIFESRAESP